jgi:hypothetical protein
MVRPRRLPPLRGTRRARPARRNPLLADPPSAIHRLRAAGERQFERVLGRRPTADDYRGVHTTGDLGLAAVYAMGATDRGDRGPEDPWPVVLQLDVRRLRALPDIDAIKTGAEILGEPDLRERVARMLAEGKDPGWIRMSLTDGYDEERPDNVTEALAMASRRDPLSAFLAVYEGRSEEVFERALRRWTRTGEAPPAVLAALVDQRRYLHDFGPARVVRVLAVQPMHGDIFDEGLDEDMRRAQWIEQYGFQVFTLEDLANGSVHPHTEEVWHNRRLARLRGGHTQYHGTSSETVRQALPEIPLPRTAPFPIRPGWDEMPEPDDED